MEVDFSELRSSMYRRFTTYTNSFFLLRVPLMINEALSTFGCSERVLTVDCRYPSHGITFDSFVKEVNAVVKKYGISETTNHWIEDVPLFELKYDTPDGIKKFIHSAELVQIEIASAISAQLSASFTTSHCCHPPVVVHTEVFLVTPDPARKDADLILVTPENLSTCLAKQNKAEVFNFGELFRRYRMTVLQSHQLFEDLNEIVEWYELGIYLEIPEAELKNTKHGNDDVKGRRREMLRSWLQKSPQPTWAIIINALTHIGRRNLAYKLALKYSVPEEAKQVPTPKKRLDSIQQRFSKRVQQLQSDIETEDMELAKKKQTATEAQIARDIARGRLDEVGQEVVTNVELLIKKSSDTYHQLELKQSELKALRKFPGKKENHTIQEIQNLREEHAAIQTELASQKEKARSFPEQLQHAYKELAEKSAIAQERVLAQKILETSLEHKRETVDQLLIQEGDFSDLQHCREIKSQLVTAKKELEAKTSEMDILKQIVANRNREVERLSAELLSREALLQTIVVQLGQSQTEEREKKKELQRLNEEVSDLRNKLFRAEDAKQKAQQKMAAAEQKIRLLQERVKDMMQNPPPVPPKPKPVQSLLPSIGRCPLLVTPKPESKLLQFQGRCPSPVQRKPASKLQPSKGRCPSPVQNPSKPSRKPVSKLQPSKGRCPSAVQNPSKPLRKPASKLQPSKGRCPPPVLPKPTQKPAAKLQPLHAPSKATWEYAVFKENSAEIIEMLAGVNLAGRIADKLSAASIIGKSVTEDAQSYGPGVNETRRVRCIITAIKDKIKLDAQRYHDFREILVSIGPDAETALHYMPEKDPTVNKSATTMPSEDQGYTIAQHQIDIQDIQWQTGKSTPEELWRGAAVSHSKIAYFNAYYSTVILAYDSEQKLWQRLPDCHCTCSALVVAQDNLTTVGGFQDRKPTKSLASLTGKGKGKEWTELFPQMPTARYHIAAVTSGRNVIVTGGDDNKGRALSTVEILDTELRQWSSAASLPHPIGKASITVCGDLLYLLGGNDRNGDQTLSVFTSSITSLLHQQQETANRPAVWHQATDTRYYGSTAVSVGGQLLAIGGSDKDKNNTSSIVAYDPTSRKWHNMGHMATPRCQSLVTLLPNNEIIVAGGFGGEETVELGNIVIV